MASFKAKRGWENLDLESIEPKVEDNHSIDQSISQNSIHQLQEKLSPKHHKRNKKSLRLGKLSNSTVSRASSVSQPPKTSSRSSSVCSSSTNSPVDTSASKLNFKETSPGSLSTPTNFTQFKRQKSGSGLSSKSPKSPHTPKNSRNSEIRSCVSSFSASKELQQRTGQISYHADRQRLRLPSSIIEDTAYPTETQLALAYPPSFLSRNDSPTSSIHTNFSDKDSSLYSPLQSSYSYNSNLPSPIDVHRRDSVQYFSHNSTPPPIDSIDSPKRTFEQAFVSEESESNHHCGEASEDVNKHEIVQEDTENVFAQQPIEDGNELLFATPSQSNFRGAGHISPESVNNMFEVSTQMKNQSEAQFFHPPMGLTTPSSIRSSRSNSYMSQYMDSSISPLSRRSNSAIHLYSTGMDNSSYMVTGSQMQAPIYGPPLESLQRRTTVPLYSPIQHPDPSQFSFLPSPTVPRNQYEALQQNHMIYPGKNLTTGLDQSTATVDSDPNSYVQLSNLSYGDIPMHQGFKSVSAVSANAAALAVAVAGDNYEFQQRQKKSKGSTKRKKAMDSGHTFKPHVNNSGSGDKVEDSKEFNINYHATTHSFNANAESSNECHTLDARENQHYDCLQNQMEFQTPIRQITKPINVLDNGTPLTTTEKSVDSYTRDGSQNEQCIDSVVMERHLCSTSVKGSLAATKVIESGSTITPVTPSHGSSLNFNEYLNAFTPSPVKSMLHSNATAADGVRRVLNFDSFDPTTHDTDDFGSRTKMSDTIVLTPGQHQSKDLYVGSAQIYSQSKLGENGNIKWSGEVHSVRREV